MTPQHYGCCVNSSFDLTITYNEHEFLPEFFLFDLLQAMLLVKRPGLKTAQLLLWCEDEGNLQARMWNGLVKQ